MTTSPLKAEPEPALPEPANSEGDVAGRSYQRNTAVLMSNITRMMRTHFDRRARSIGLTRSQWLAMNRISLNQGISPSRLAEWMEVEHVTASRLVSNLETMGWAERRQNPEDRRERLVHLTDSGIPILEKINKLGEETEQEMFSILDEIEKKQFSLLVEKLHSRISSLVFIDKP